MKKAVLFMALVSGLFADQSAVCEKVATNYVKPMLVNPDSYTKVKFDLKDSKGSKFGVLTYKATNVYGGVIEKMMFFDFDVNGSRCIITGAVGM